VRVAHPRGDLPSERDVRDEVAIAVRDRRPISAIPAGEGATCSVNTEVLADTALDRAVDPHDLVA
jgi:hypothetical protein